MFLTTLKKAGNTLKSEEGMTLIEITIAMAIIIITVILMFESLIAMANLRDSTAQRSLASAHVTTVIEEIKGLKYED